MQKRFFLKYFMHHQGGPDVPTTQRWCDALQYKLQIGMHDGFFHIVVDLLKKYGLTEAPCIISEQSIDVDKRLTVQPRYAGCNGPSEYIQVFGLCGPSYKVRSFVSTHADTLACRC